MSATPSEAPTMSDAVRASAFARGTGIVLTLAYPVVMLGAWWAGQPRIGGMAMLAMLWLQRWLRVGTIGAMLRKLSALDGCVVLMLSAASVTISVTNSEFALRCYPALVNLGLFASFAATLVRPPSMIERFARVREPQLPPQAVRYTRRVTIVWCVFFVLNAIVSACTAWMASGKAWALYNGVVGYGLAGVLIAGEWLFRSCFVKPVGAGEAA
jgi:uncharacterized membrane protein